MLMRSSCATYTKNIGKIFYNAATQSTGASRVDARKSIIRELDWEVTVLLAPCMDRSLLLQYS